MKAMNLLLVPEFLCPGACPPAPPATESAAGLFLPVITEVGQLLPELFLCGKERFL